MQTHNDLNCRECSRCGYCCLDNICTPGREYLEEYAPNILKVYTENADTLVCPYLEYGPGGNTTTCFLPELVDPSEADAIRAAIGIGTGCDVHDTILDYRKECVPFCSISSENKREYVRRRLIAKEVYCE